MENNLSNNNKSDIDYEYLLGFMKEERKKRRAETTSPLFLKSRVEQGREYTYIKREACINYLDNNFLEWEWDFDPSSITRGEYFFYGAGCLRVIEPISKLERKMRTIGECRYHIKDGQIQYKDFYKTVDTDSLKRSIVLLGGFHDVYTDSEEDGQNDDTEPEVFVKLVKQILMLAESDNKDITLESFQNIIYNFVKGRINLENIIKTLEKLNIKLEF